MAKVPDIKEVRKQVEEPKSAGGGGGRTVLTVSDESLNTIKEVLKENNGKAALPKETVYRLFQYTGKAKHMSNVMKSFNRVLNQHGIAVNTSHGGKYIAFYYHEEGGE